VFDLDGTLVDSYGAIAKSLNHARARVGLPELSVEFVRQRVGHGLESLVAELVDARRVDDAVRWFRERYAQVCRAETRALPGIRMTLERLRASGLRTAVASNKPAYFSRIILDELDLAPYVEFVAGPDTVGTTKPDPRMLRACLDALGLAAAETLYVGDMALDAETAARAGVPVVLVRGGSAGDDELERTGEHVLASLTELPALLCSAG
jgi:phosphoglycolate phosphatase